MKTSLFLGTALGALLFSSVSSAAQTRYHADLSPDNEPSLDDPTAAQNATGSVDAIFDDATNTLCGTVTYASLSGAQTGIHIHDATDDSIAKSIDGGGAASPVSFSFTLSAGEATTLAGGNYYVNIHTAANGGGEERGDLTTDNVNASYTCPAAATDAGTDGGSTSSSSSSSSSSGSSGTSTSSSSSSGSSSGASTVRADSGTNSAAPKDDSGCSTTGSSDPGNGLAFAVGLGVAVAGFARGRKKKH